MANATEMTERHGRILAELSELGLALARDVQGRALAAEDAEAVADLSLAFHRISRSVRQTLALEAKLERDRQRQEREDRADAARQAENRVQHRKAQVRIAVERAVWSEAEGDEAERLLADLDDLLDEESLADGFTEAPLDAHIARLRRDLGLSASPEMPIQAQTPPTPPPHRGEVGWRSSA